MNYNDKKLLALTIQYLDEAIEDRFEGRIERLESFIESSPLVINEDNSISLVEGPPGPRGPRGFRGEQGYEGPAGQDASPLQVAKELRLDESFVRSITGPEGKPGQKGDKGDSADPIEVAEQLKSDSFFIDEIRGPEGLPGRDGKDADINEIVKRLKRSKVFTESIRGDRGPIGEMGPIGPTGIGVNKVELLSDGTLNYEKTDGSSEVAGKISLPEEYDDTSLRSELKKIKDELTKTKSELTAQVTRSIMSSGGTSSGGGEVRIEFMDDFFRQSKVDSVNGGLVEWDPNIGKQGLFKVSEISIQELINRITNIEEYLNLNVPPFTTSLGVEPVVLSATNFLVGDGSKISIPRGDDSDYNYLYSARLTDPNSNNMVMDTTLFAGTESFDLEANQSLFGYDLYLAYIKEPDANTGPIPRFDNINLHIDSSGTYGLVDYASNNIDNIEAWRLMINKEEAIPVYYFHDDKLIIQSNVPMFGASIQMMVNEPGMTGSNKLVQTLSGTSYAFDLVTLGINNILNYVVLETATRKVVDLIEYLDPTELKFESSFDMTGLEALIWYN